MCKACFSDLYTHIKEVPLIDPVQNYDITAGQYILYHRILNTYTQLF